MLAAVPAAPRWPALARAVPSRRAWAAAPGPPGPPRLGRRPRPAWPAAPAPPGPPGPPRPRRPARPPDQVRVTPQQRRRRRVGRPELASLVRNGVAGEYVGWGEGGRGERRCNSRRLP